MTAFLGVGIYGDWQQYQISKYCKRVDVTTLDLNPGEVSDGYVLFRSDREWTTWADPSDTLSIEDRLETLPTIMSVDSISQIYIASGRCEKPAARTYNQVLVKTLGIVSANIEGYWGKLKEVSFTDSVVFGKRLFSTVYETTVDSVPAYFDVTMIVELDSPKCCVVVRADKQQIGSDWAVKYAESLRFDLQNVAKCKDDEDGNNAKDKNPNRTAYGKNQSDSNMFASLFHGICPRHLFRIVTLKYHEREITYRKCDYVFYNL